MGFEFIHVRPDRVDLDDRRYQISTNESTHDLALSISAIGLLQPPAVVDTGGRLVVVCGFRRLRALRELESPPERIHLRRLPSATPPDQLAVMAIADNASQRQLNPVEQSRGYAMLQKWCGTPEDLRRATEASGLPASRKAMARILPIARMPALLQRAIVDGSIALPVARQIDRLDDADRRAMIEFLSTISTGLNVQRELVDAITEVSRRDAIPIHRLLGQSRFQNILTDDQTPAPQRVLTLRRLVKSERFPALHRAEKDFQNALKTLHLSPRIQIQPPPFFEGRTYQITLKIESRRQMNPLQEELKRLADAENVLPE